jgi:hypothetical protein
LVTFVILQDHPGMTFAALDPAGTANNLSGERISPTSSAA